MCTNMQSNISAHVLFIFVLFLIGEIARIIQEQTATFWMTLLCFFSIFFLLTASNIICMQKVNTNNTYYKKRKTT